MSLRLRIWLACLGGTLVLGAALWWIAGTRVGPGGFDPATLVIALVIASGAGLTVATLLALWLDHHVTGHVGGVARALESGQIEPLRDLPSSHSWGELSLLGHAVQQRLMREQRLAAAAEDADRMREAIAAMRERLERWIATERWEPLAIHEGPLAELGASLDRGLGRDAALREQNLEVVRMMRGEMEQARLDARESVEQAERGFVEATSLLTTVRELQRLGSELQGALGAPEPMPAAAPDEGERARETAIEVIGELVGASVESVEHLAAGLRRVQDVAEQVHVLANRATLIALNATLAAAGGGPSAGEIGDDLKSLARDVREATERTDALTRDLVHEVDAASTRMAEVRGTVASRLAALPEPAAPGAPAPAPRDSDSMRLLDRVREMIQDATRKGERLSAAGERSSRAAQRLVRRLEEQTREFDGLAVRLEPGGALPEEPRVEPAAAPPEAPRATLRLLDHGTADAADDAGGEVETQ